MAAKDTLYYKTIQIILIILPFFYGMYYEFCGAVMTAVISGILLIILLKNHKLQISLSVGFLLSMIFVCLYLFSILYAVDSGMAAYGVIKLLWIPLFLVLCSQLQKEKREKLFSIIPYIGTALCLIGFAAYFLPWIKNYFYINGRLSSGFQYANTFALYLLIGIIILFDKKELVWRDYLSGAILLCGIALSGSRIVFVLTAFIVLYFIIRHRNKKLACGIFAFALLLIIYIYIKGDITNVGRITTFSLTDSTLLGRFLYAKDALGLLLKHPFGMGHFGYYYMENGIQSGVYSVQYVHNDWLQIGLDIGLFPMLLYFISIIYCLFSKELKHHEKIILSVIFLHGLLDFDSAYGAIQCIVFIIMHNKTITWRDKQIEAICIKRNQWSLLFSAFFIIGCYFSVPLIARYQNHMEIAVKWYPWDTEAKLKILSELEDTEKADNLADEILRQNDTCALAYYAKAMVADFSYDYENMIHYQKKSIERNYFNHEAYSNYTYMLYNGLCYAIDNDDEAVYTLCSEELLKLPSYMDDAKDRLSKLGKMINDQPDLEPDEDMIKIIDAIS
ncbi:MAG: O-antigen ligase family protein [Lachnospiraceae bacterium]|nr:O-antigen ligase family protein [Lachnospiraceae bacterium]